MRFSPTVPKVSDTMELSFDASEVDWYVNLQNGDQYVLATVTDEGVLEIYLDSLKSVGLTHRCVDG